MRVLKSISRQYLWLTLLSVAIFLLTFPLAVFGFSYKIIIGSIVYFATALLVLKYNNYIGPGRVIILIALPIVITLIGVNLIHYSQSSVSLPSNLFLFFAPVTAYIFYKQKNYLFSFTYIFLICLWLVKGEKMFHNYRSYGITTNEVREQFPGVKIYDSIGEVDVLIDNKKTFLIDFWNSRCGNCYQQFPIIDSFYKNLDTSKYDILVVNIPFRNEKKEDNYKLLDEFKYSFKQFYTDNASVMDSLNIRYFPTAIIVKNRTILFRDDFFGALEYLKSN
jgi:thiol-disulfide isomerase/thioredoxin